MPLAPELKQVRINPNKLLLDPNNPRLFTQERERVQNLNISDPGVQDNTMARINSNEDKFKIKDLIKSILSHGYIPEAGGYIFVRKIDGTENTVVLEGNRRLTAIRLILRDRDKYQNDYPEVLDSLKSIDVLEIIDDIPEEEMEKKIAYLLGTCHHGSHKSWSPFAKAKEIYTTYLKESGQNWETFKYTQEIGNQTASLMNTSEKSVKERLAVYRAMKQLSGTNEMGNFEPNGGIIDEYYSLIKEGVFSTGEHIKKYIPTHPDTFLLEEIAITRMISLCKFNGEKQRSDSPMNDPMQWRYLDRIFNDDDENKRLNNLARVEEGMERPDEVWAERAEELRKLNWKMWLEQVLAILKDVRMGEDLDSDEARRVVDILSRLLNSVDNANIQTDNE